MSEALIPFLFFGGFVAVFVIIVWQSGKASGVTRANAQELADRLGLALAPATPTFGRFYPPPRAQGTVRGKRVELFAYSTGSGKSRKTWAAIGVTPAQPGGLTFSFTRQGLGSRVLSLFGAKEIEVGNRAFDERWFIQTNQPEFLRAALLPELQQKLMDLDRKKLPGSIRLEDGTVKYAEQGSFYSRETCDRVGAMLDVLCDLADVAEVWAQSRQGT